MDEKITSARNKKGHVKIAIDGHYKKVNTTAKMMSDEIHLMADRCHTLSRNFISSLIAEKQQ